MERASDFFLSRLRPVWAPFSRAFMMVWALQAQTKQTHFECFILSTLDSNIYNGYLQKTQQTLFLLLQMEQQFPSCLSGSFLKITYCNPPTGSLLLSDMPLGPITWAYVFLHPTSLIEGMPLWNCLILFNCRENTAVCKSIQKILVLLILRMDVLTIYLLLICVFLKKGFFLLIFMQP